MAYDSEAKKLAIKAIGTVESGLNYRSINYNDPITVGFMQWYGTRAAGVLARIRSENPSSWVGIPSSLTSALDAHAPTDSAYWTNRYLSQAEGEPLREVLNNNKAIQNTVAIEDMEAYKDTAIRQGMDPEGNTQAVLFFFVMYHQSPRRALQVVASASPQADIERLYAVCVNEPVLGQYKTRYTTAKNIILSGDTSGIGDTPDPTPAPEPLPGGDTDTGTTRPLGELRSVTVVGDTVHVRLRDGRTIVCVPNGRGMYLPVADGAAGAPVPPLPPVPPTSPPPVGTSTGEALVAWMVAHTGVYAYSQGATRLTPDANMYTDCSGLVRYAYQQVAGIEIGTYTGAQWTQGTLVTEGSGTIDASLLLPGDLIFFDWTGGRGTVDHVEMIINQTEMIGHGGPMNGPIVKNIAQRVGYAVKYVVRRHV